MGPGTGRSLAGRDGMPPLAASGAYQPNNSFAATPPKQVLRTKTAIAMVPYSSHLSIDANSMVLNISLLLLVDGTIFIRPVRF